MRKEIFLEYKFGDYDNQQLRASGANEVIAWMENLNPNRLKQLRNWGVKVGLSFAATQQGLCPSDPATRMRIASLFKQGLEYQPDFFCLDHLRFDGYWEGIDASGNMPDTHPPCSYCQGTDRYQVIADLVQWINNQLPASVSWGYFAVPFYPEQLKILGQDHQQLSEYCDYISPMLYHRMTSESIDYIHRYTKYLAKLTQKPVVPAIAVKDMPDELADEITEDILKAEYEQATQSPSAGVCWFSWDGAIEKHKTATLAKIWSK